MPTSVMPEALTKVSYILEKKDKAKVAAAAKKAGVSMSMLITEALADKGILSEAALKRMMARSSQQRDAA